MTRLYIFADVRSPAVGRGTRSWSRVRRSRPARITSAFDIV